MRIRWSLAVVIGLGVAASVGVLAWALSPVAPALSAAVFAVACLPFGVTLGWLLAVAPRTLPPSPHTEDSAERTWLTAALAGTATDVVLVAGLGLTAAAITRVELPTTLVLLAVVMLAFGSAAVRYALARVRATRA